ncbi:heavy-metal-associated domain-containing protein [Saccharibacillus sacchari]|uniref:heavy-metal-associated domain-containing protein n=1 Tax=Saccharibacillus sacchari TaxID=456493 RepID=UPI0004BAEFEB|nr:heavy metal-associated domain-containing protein [Saccharibacillus sacchari]
MMDHQATFQLQPLSCPSCIQKIEKMLVRTHGVHSASVLFHAGKVKVSFDLLQITAAELRKRIEKLGYPVQTVREGAGSA